LGLLVFFADHLAQSIQVDAIMEAVQRNTLAVIKDGAAPWRPGSSNVAGTGPGALSRLV
jgi:uncharacterized membrane protein